MSARGSYIPGISPQTLKDAGLDAHGVRERPLADLPETAKPYEVPCAPIVLKLGSKGLEYLSLGIRAHLLSQGIGYEAVSPELVLVDAGKAKEALTPRAARLMDGKRKAPLEKPPHEILLEKAVNFTKTDLGGSFGQQRLVVLESERRTVRTDGHSAVELSLTVDNGSFIHRKGQHFVGAAVSALETQLGLQRSHQHPDALRVPLGVIHAPYKQTRDVAELVQQFMPDHLSVEGIAFGNIVA